MGLALNMHMKRLYIDSDVWSEVDLEQFPCIQAGLMRGGATVRVTMADDVCLRFLLEYPGSVKRLEFINSDAIEHVFGMEIDQI